MVRASRVAPCLFLLALIPTLMSMALNARDVSYVDQLFYKIEKFPLASHDRIALRALRNRFEEETIKQPQPPLPYRDRIDELLLCTAGLLDENQFLAATGLHKSVDQQFRYELRQMQIELVRLKQLSQLVRRESPDD